LSGAALVLALIVGFLNLSESWGGQTGHYHTYEIWLGVATCTFLGNRRHHLLPIEERGFKLLAEDRFPSECALKNDKFLFVTPLSEQFVQCRLFLEGIAHEWLSISWVYRPSLTPSVCFQRDIYRPYVTINQLGIGFDFYPPSWCCTRVSNGQFKVLSWQECFHGSVGNAKISAVLRVPHFPRDLVRLFSGTPSQASENHSQKDENKASLSGPSHILLRPEIFLGPFLGALSAAVCGAGLWLALLGFTGNRPHWYWRLCGWFACLFGWTLLNVVQNWSLGREWGVGWWWLTGSG
jgi:hypothetical protein